MPWMMALQQHRCGAELGCLVAEGQEYYRTRLGLVRCRQHAPVPYAKPETVTPAPRVAKGKGSQPFVSLESLAKRFDAKAAAAGEK